MSGPLLAAGGLIPDSPASSWGGSLDSATFQAEVLVP
jgi:hypothetical protein